MTNYTENEISGIVLDQAIKIHTTLGPGLLESVYHKILYHQLIKLELQVEFEKALPVHYDGEIYEFGFRCDLIVENKVIVELKSVQDLASVHYKQVLTYLKLTNLKLGLLINFIEELLKDGFHRL